MNISKEMRPGHEARITIDLIPADYTEAFARELNKTRKQVQMKGFRTGEVPKSMVQKLYGKSILLDELNKIVAAELEKYITENNIAIMGQPLPVPMEDFNVDFDKPAPFSFSFDLGLSPDFKFEVPAKAIDFYDITVTEKEINESIEHVRNKHADIIDPDLADAQSSVYGNFVQLNEDGTVMEAGINHNGYILLEYVKNEEELNKFLGCGKGSTIIFNPKKAFDNDTELMHLLNIKREQAATMVSDFSITVARIYKRIPAEVNQALFDKVYGEGNIASEEEFRKRVADDVKAYFNSRSNGAFVHMAEHMLSEEFNIELPDAFLRRWIKYANEKPVTDEQLEKEYPMYASELKLRMIYNRIFDDQKMEVQDDEIRFEAHQYLRGVFEQYGLTNMPDDFESYVDNYLKEEKNISRLAETVQKNKVNMHLLTVLNKNIIPVTLEEFEAAQSEHKHHHHH